MTLRQRLVIGAIGGMAPVILNLLVVDLVTTLTDLTVLVVAAYLVKVLAMSLAGSLSAWLHEDEMKAVKLFQLGMVAPALLTSMMNGAAVRAAAPPAPSAAPTGATLLMGTPVFAAALIADCPACIAHGAADEAVTPLTYPEESATAQIARGLFGVPRDKRDCLVQVAIAQDGATAKLFASSYRRTYPTLPFRVFSPGAGVHAWLVTIGGLLTRHEADQIQQTLIGKPSLPPVTVRQLPPPASAQ